MSSGEFIPEPPTHLAEAIASFTPVIKATRVLDGRDANLSKDVIERLAAKHKITPQVANSVGIVAANMLDRKESDELEESFYDATT